MFQLIIAAALIVLSHGQDTTTTTVSPPQTVSCEGPHEIYLPQGVAPNCDTVCANIGKPCTRVYAKAPSGCYCLPDHARNASGVCVPISKCRIFCSPSHLELPNLHDLSRFAEDLEKEEENPARRSLSRLHDRRHPFRRLPHLRERLTPDRSMSRLWRQLYDSPQEQWTPSRDSQEPCRPSLDSESWAPMEPSPPKLARIPLQRNVSPQFSPAMPPQLQPMPPQLQPLPEQIQLLQQGNTVSASAVSSVSLNPGLQWVDNWTPYQSYWETSLTPAQLCSFPFILN